MIWRDDDISRTTNLAHLLQVDDEFQRTGQVHTIACIMDGLAARPDLIAAIQARRMEPQLHCWTHDDLTKDAASLAALPQAVQAMEDLFGVRPTVLYPPWNRSDERVEAVAQALGLMVACEKLSLPAYIRAGGYVQEHVVNFHYWDADESRLIGAALRLHAGIHA